MDIQKQLQAGKGPGYERWAKVFNLKQMAKMLNYLMEHRLYDWGALEKHMGSVKAEYQKSVEALRMVERRLKVKQQMIEHVRNYVRAREVFTTYREGRYNDGFPTEHAVELRQYKAAISSFQQLKEERRSVPKMMKLQSDICSLSHERRLQQSLEHRLKREIVELMVIRENLSSLLVIKQEQKANVSKKIYF